jgi:hypothetical protein
MDGRTAIRAARLHLGGEVLDRDQAESGREGDTLARLRVKRPDRHLVVERVHVQKTAEFSVLFQSDITDSPGAPQAPPKKHRQPAGVAPAFPGSGSTGAGT